MTHTRKSRLQAFVVVFFFIAGGLSAFPDVGTESPLPGQSEDIVRGGEPLGRFPFIFDGRILIPLGINESPPMDIILDTGFPQRLLLLMHKESGDELGFTYVRTVDGARGAGSGENKPIHLTKGEHLTLPDVDLGQVLTAVMEESRDVSVHHNKGVIGGAVFIPYVVEIDFINSVISLHDPESFTPGESWEEIPLTFERNIPILETTVCLNEGNEIPVRLLVDTGGKPPLALAVDDEKKLVPPAKVIHTLAGTGLRGDVFADHGRISGLKIGSHLVENVISGFWTGDEAPVLDEINADGVLGLGCLAHFNLIFDYAHRRMLIKSNKFFSDPFEMNMAGMAIAETTSGEWIVYYVMDDSEAAKKGLQKGDVLVEMASRETGDLGYRELKRLFEREGKTVAVKIRRDGELREVKLRLKRII